MTNGRSRSKRHAAQNQRGKNEPDAEHVHLAGRGQGRKAGDDQQEKRGLEERSISGGALRDVVAEDIRV